MGILRIPSSLPADLESLVQETIGCCIAVHRELGPGLLEKVYPRAIDMELESRGIRYSTERALPIRYRGMLFVISGSICL